MHSGSGYACPRVPHRFDLGAHFGTSAGRGWQWSASARAAVVARHGASSESRLITRKLAQPLTCATSFTFRYEYLLTFLLPYLPSYPLTKTFSPVQEAKFSL